MPAEAAPETETETSLDGVAAVDRAFAIVRALIATAQPMTLADMARATGYYKSTLLRLLASLERAGMVNRIADGRYSVGPFAHQLGRAYEARYQLSDLLLPILRRLVDSGTESASFQVQRDAHTRLCVLRVDSHHSTLDRIQVGTVMPLGRGAAGKLLAYLNSGLRLSETQWVFTSRGETDPNCAAIACPVFGRTGELHGAISLSGPIERFDDASLQRMTGLILQASRDATAQLGGVWPQPADPRAA